MKKFVVCMAAMALMLTGCGAESAAPAEAKYTAGTVEASAEGFNGEVAISVEFSENEIVSITVAENDETPEVGGAALETLVASALESQSAEIDGVASATFTSDAFKSALASAIATATGAEA